MKHVLLLLSFLSFSAALAGNAVNDSDTQSKPTTDANITGHTVSASTGEHLPYITVALKRTAIATAADATGHFVLRNLPEGEYILTASSMGYKTQEVKVALEKGKTIEVNFGLEEETINIEQVVITSSRNITIKKEAASIVNVASSKLFNTVNSVSVSDAMNFQPGLRVEMTCGNCGVPQLRINGLEGQYSQILLDGHPIFSSLAGVYGLEQLPGGDGGEIFRNETTKSFFDAGLKLAYTFHPTPATGLEINGGVKNIFDSYQPDPDFGAAKDAGYIYGPAMPRMFFVGVKLTL